MSISYPLSFPSTPSFKTLRIGAETSTPKDISPFSLKEQIYEYSGNRWTLDIAFPPMSNADYATLSAFLLKLHGTVGTFLAGDPLITGPQGVGSGTPLVMGASQTGYTLIVDGWPAGITNILKAGDQFQIGNYLYVNLNDVNSDGSGVTTLDIWPSLRGSISDNAPLTLASPKGLFRLAESRVDFDSSVEKVHNISFRAVEALP